LIWNEIDSQLGQMDSKKNKTLAYLSHTLEKKTMLTGDEYFRYFQDKFRRTDSSIVGFVCVSGNRVIGCDIFAWNDLFYNQLEPLLRGYIDGAVLFGGPVSLTNNVVKEYMDNVLANEKGQEDFVGKNGKLFRQGGNVIHINTF